MTQRLLYIFLMVVILISACETQPDVVLENSTLETTPALPENQPAPLPVETSTGEVAVAPANTPVASPSIQLPSTPSAPEGQLGSSLANLPLPTPPSAGINLPGITLPGITSTVTLTATQTSPVSMPLEDKWYEDSDGNVIPDFLEIALGYDPLFDDCAPTMCLMDGAEGAAMPALEQNVLIILDASGSMAEMAGSQTRMEAAKEVLFDYVAATSDIVNIGFMLLGHKGDNTNAGKPASCAGVELVAPLGTINAEQFAAIISPIMPTGWTPLGAALLAAEDTFAGREGADNKVILITDGLETCGGDPVAAALRLHNDAAIKVTVDVVGFGIQKPAEVAQLQQIAEAGGGIYFDAKTKEDVREYFLRAFDESRQKLDYGLCISMNSVDYYACTNSMVVNAVRHIRLEQIKAREPAASAFRELIGAIELAKEESNRRYEAFKAQLNELLGLSEEMRQRRDRLSGNE